MMKYNLIYPLILSTLLSACANDNENKSLKAATSRIQLVEQGRYHSNIFDQSAAEVVTYDKSTKQTFVVNAQSGKIDIISAADISKPYLITSLDVQNTLKKELNKAAGAVNSVDIANGLLAVAIEGFVKTSPGWIVFYNSADLSFIKALEVGSLPDMLTFTKEGKQLVSAIEGEPSDKNYAVDPEGEIAIIDIDWQSPILNTQLTRLTFTDFNHGASRFAELPEQLVLNGYKATVAQELEPEYIAINNNSTARVTASSPATSP